MPGVGPLAVPGVGVSSYIRLYLGWEIAAKVVPGIGGLYKPNKKNTCVG